MKCPFCSGEISSDAKYCDYCGSEITNKSSSTVINVTNNYFKEEKRNKKSLIIAAGTVFAFVLIIVIIVVVKNVKTKPIANSSSVQVTTSVIQEDKTNANPVRSVVLVDSIDYADSADFENALNEGLNLEGKTVTFQVREFHPNSAFGYNMWAGEHLNFCSSTHPNTKEGDIVSVRADKIISYAKSWIIYYTFVEIGD